jgi:hypothetical protein
METRAPFVIVGAFVLAAIFAVFGFVFWLHNTSGVGARTSYHVQFRDPVPGLLVGAAVLFKASASARSRRCRSPPMIRGGSMQPSRWRRQRRSVRTPRLAWISRA